MTAAIFLAIAVILLSISSLINKHVVSNSHPFTIQWMQGLIGLCLLPVWVGLSKKFAPEDHFNKHNFALSALTCLMSSIGFILFLYVLKQKPAYIVTSILSTYPALTMLICAAMGTEKLTWPRIAVVVLISSGIFLIQYFNGE